MKWSVYEWSVWSKRFFNAFFNEKTFHFKIPVYIKYFVYIIMEFDIVNI